MSVFGKRIVVTKEDSALKIKTATLLDKCKSSGFLPELLNRYKQDFTISRLQAFSSNRITACLLAIDNETQDENERAAN
jgi:hypothetical protein